MACRLFGAKQFSEPVLAYCQLNNKEHILVRYYLKFKCFILENVFENIVCEMAASLSLPQCANLILPDHSELSTTWIK